MGCRRGRLGVAASLLCCSLLGCDGAPSCPLIECSAGAFIDVAVVNDPSTLIGATIKVCVDQVCSEGPLPDEPSDHSQPLPGELFAHVRLEPLEEGVDIVVEVVAGVDENGSPDPTDIYTTTVTDGAGAEIVSGRWSVDFYLPYYPGGEECGACYYGILQRE